MAITGVLPCHKDAIEQIRRACGHALSSHAFASLYLWQEQLGLSLLLQENFFTVKTAAFGENAWFFPCGEKNAYLPFLRERMQTPGFSLVYLRERDCRFLEEQFPGQWCFIRDADSDEYLCGMDAYIAMEGGKYAALRKYMHRLERESDIFVKPLTDETLADALHAVALWEQGKHSVGAENLEDDRVSATALRQWKLLELSGVVVYRGKAPISVFAGFPLTEDTLDVVIGKTCKDAPDGTVFYALREYMKQEQGRYTYCNHEEDLGIEGIRSIKNRLRPMGKNEIWKAVTR